MEQCPEDFPSPEKPPMVVFEFGVDAELGELHGKRMAKSVKNSRSSRE